MYGRFSRAAARARAARPHVHRQQVVHARSGDELLVTAQVGGRLHGVGHQVPAGDLARREPRLLLQEGDQVAVADVVAEAPDRLEVPLLVQLEAVRRHGTVQVDGELGHPQQRPVHVHQPRRTVPQSQPPGETEIAVQPGVEQRPAVDLDGDLAKAVAAGVGARLDPQVRGVGVRADDTEGRVGVRPFGDEPGHDRATAQHVLAATRPVPGVRLGDLPEARLLQPLGGVRHGVVRRGTRRQEGQQVVGVAAVEAGGSLMGFTLTTYEGPLPTSGTGPHKGDVGFREAVPVLSRNVFRGCPAGVRGRPEGVPRSPRRLPRPAPSGPVLRPRRPCGPGSVRAERWPRRTSPPRSCRCRTAHL